MAKKLDPFTRANKDWTEALLGHQPGRPTFSRRTGRVISAVTGIDEETSIDLFHVGLVVGALALIARKPTVKPRPVSESSFP